MKAGSYGKGLILLSIAFFLISGSVSGATNNTIIRGTISKMSVPDSAITINTSEELMTGTIPRGKTNIYSMVFFGFTPGDRVVAVRSEDPEMKWITLAKINKSASNQEYISKIVGDPALVPHPLMDDYSVDISIIPNCSRCQESICQAAYANITLMKSGKVVSRGNIFALQDYNLHLIENGTSSGIFYETDPDSGITVSFIAGETDAGICSGVVTNSSNLNRIFEIWINPPPPSHAVMYRRPYDDVTDLMKYILVSGAGIVAICGLIYFVRGGKKRMS